MKIENKFNILLSDDEDELLHTDTVAEVIDKVERAINRKENKQAKKKGK